jgi:3-methyladenine DNA glycosylase Tag
MVNSSYLSEMSRRVFRAGLKHSMVDAKWPAFEKAFHHFNLDRVAMMSDEELDELMGNRAIIRHWGKIQSVRHNAGFLREMARLHGSVGQWLANWPGEDVVGLWTQLRKEAAQMGGNSGPSFLRMVGKDTFVLSEDVVVALKAQGIVDKKPTSQRDLKATQQAFNQWRQQSGRPLCQLSRMLSLTVNY